MTDNPSKFKDVQTKEYYLSNYSIKHNRQFQITKLPLNFHGILIPLTKVNNIPIFQKNPTCSFG